MNEDRFRLKLEIGGVIKVRDRDNWKNHFYMVMERPSTDGYLFEYVKRCKYLEESLASTFFSKWSAPQKIVKPEQYSIGT